MHYFRYKSSAALLSLISFPYTCMQTSVNFPRRCPPTTPSLYKPKDEISLPSAEKMALYRAYIAACKAVSEKVQVTEETSKVMVVYLVRCTTPHAHTAYPRRLCPPASTRQVGDSNRTYTPYEGYEVSTLSVVTPVAHMLMLATSRLLAASRLQDEVTIDVWEQAKELDSRRQAR